METTLLAYWPIHVDIYHCILIGVYHKCVVLLSDKQTHTLPVTLTSPATSTHRLYWYTVRYICTGKGH